MPAAQSILVAASNTTSATPSLVGAGVAAGFDSLATFHPLDGVSSGGKGGRTATASNSGRSVGGAAGDVEVSSIYSGGGHRRALLTIDAAAAAADHHPHRHMSTSGSLNSTTTMVFMTEIIKKMLIHWRVLRPQLTENVAAVSSAAALEGHLHVHDTAPSGDGGQYESARVVVGRGTAATAVSSAARRHPEASRSARVEVEQQQLLYFPTTTTAGGGGGDLVGSIALEGQTNHGSVRNGRSEISPTAAAGGVSGNDGSSGIDGPNTNIFLASRAGSGSTTNMAKQQVPYHPPQFGSLQPRPHDPLDDTEKRFGEDLVGIVHNSDAGEIDTTSLASESSSAMLGRDRSSQTNKATNSSDSQASPAGSACVTFVAAHGGVVMPSTSSSTGGDQRRISGGGDLPSPRRCPLPLPPTHSSSPPSSPANLEMINNQQTLVASVERLTALVQNMIQMMDDVTTHLTECVGRPTLAHQGDTGQSSQPSLQQQQQQHLTLSTAAGGKAAAASTTWTSGDTYVPYRDQLVVVRRASRSVALPSTTQLTGATGAVPPPQMTIQQPMQNEDAVAVISGGVGGGVNSAELSFVSFPFGASQQSGAGGHANLFGGASAHRPFRGGGGGPPSQLRHNTQSFDDVNDLSRMGSIISYILPHHQIVTTNKVVKGEDDCGMKMINDYLMLETIGEGACGKVKLAHSTQRRHPVAIKIVRRKNKSRAAGSGASSAREVALRQEIAIMKKLRHKNIVSLYEVIDDPDAEKMYLVMQYIDRGSIGHVAPDGTCTRIEPHALAEVARQVTAGLDYLHSHGVVHRDVKPENILIDSDDRAYLADFGVSATMSAELNGFEFAEGQGFGGTPLFMAPELLARKTAEPLPYDEDDDEGGGDEGGAHNSKNQRKMITRRRRCSDDEEFDQYEAAARSENDSHEHTLKPSSCTSVPPPPPRSGPGGVRKRSSEGDGDQQQQQQQLLLESADIWSLGVTLFALVTGTMPFRSLDDVRALADENSPRMIDFDVPPLIVEHDWKRLLKSMLRPSPSDRPTAREVRTELKRMINATIAKSVATATEKTHALSSRARRMSCAMQTLNVCNSDFENALTTLSTEPSAAPTVVGFPLVEVEASAATLARGGGAAGGLRMGMSVSGSMAHLIGAPQQQAPMSNNLSFRSLGVSAAGFMTVSPSHEPLSNVSSTTTLGSPPGNTHLAPEEEQERRLRTPPESHAPQHNNSSHHSHAASAAPYAFVRPPTEGSPSTARPRVA